MISEVIVRWNAEQQYRIDVDRLAPMESDAARRWLDEQFTALDCEPLRPSGKVLLADKVLVVARAAGPDLLANAEWLAAYARAAHTVLGKPVIKVDVEGMAVSY